MIIVIRLYFLFVFFIYFPKQNQINLTDYFIAPVSCGTPPVVSHTSNVNTGTDHSDTITYTCLSGYEKTSGNLVRTCQADKNWSGSPPVCCKYHII